MSFAEKVSGFRCQIIKRIADSSWFIADRLKEKGVRLKAQR